MKISFAVEQPDSHHRDGEIGGRLQHVAGQHSEAAAVESPASGARRTRNSSRRPAGRRRNPSPPAAGAGRHSTRAASAADARDVVGIRRQLLQPMRRNHLDHRTRVAPAALPLRRVDVAEQGGAAARPAPPIVERHPRQRPQGAAGARRARCPPARCRACRRTWLRHRPKAAIGPGHMGRHAGSRSTVSHWHPGISTFAASPPPASALALKNSRVARSARSIGQSASRRAAGQGVPAKPPTRLAPTPPSTSPAVRIGSYPRASKPPRTALDQRHPSGRFRPSLLIGDRLWLGATQRLPSAIRLANAARALHETPPPRSPTLHPRRTSDCLPPPRRWPARRRADARPPDG